MRTGGRMAISPDLTSDADSGPLRRPLANPAPYATSRPATTAATFQAAPFHDAVGRADITVRRAPSTCSHVGRGNASFRFIVLLRIVRSNPCAAARVPETDPV